MSAPNTLLIYTSHLIGRHARTGFIWAAVISLYSALMIIVYPTLLESGTLDISRLPEFMLDMMGIQDMTQLDAYLEAQITGNLPLILPFFLIMTFAGAIAGAENRGALDIVLSNPLPRRHLVIANWIAIAVILIGVLLIVGASTWIVSALMDLDLDFVASMRGALNLFPICMVFGSLALALSAKMRSYGAVIGITMAVIFLMYLVAIIAELSPTFRTLGWFSALNYYENAITQEIPWGSSVFLVAVSVVLLIVAIRLFEKRDIYT